MARKLLGGELVVATHNAGKAREFSALLAPHHVAVRSAAELELAEPEETETTFAGNAALKARAAAKASGLPALADDSGLCVDALGGAPGVYSARWAGEKKDFGLAMDKVREALNDAETEDFSARFVCTLCLGWPDGRADLFEGSVKGLLVFPPRGDLGFGYDPIFQPVGETRTFAEMESDEKQAYSHRARAFNRFVDACLV
ncbi:MAG: RdgB/HAM1 family non-canonical purine NTP pyrophosphatase [Pseudomonadota bacterium]